MAYDKYIYKRFNIEVDESIAQARFVNKVNNIIEHSNLCHDNEFDIDDLEYSFCLRYGLEYRELNSLKYYFAKIAFPEYIIRLNCLLDILLKENEEKAHLFAQFITDFIDESLLDLNIRIINNKKGYTILPKGVKMLDKMYVDDVLLLTGKPKYKSVKIAFEKGLKEYLESKKDNLKIKNAVRDMQLAMDEVAKVILGDNNVGLKHLIKNDNWSKTGLNDYFKNILYQYNEMLDKLAKHKADSTFSIEEAETIIYLTGMFIRLLFSNIL